jgi:glycosyltransferase involved in cell wall biosynthesis
MVIVFNTRLLLRDRLEGIGWFTYETLSRITRNHPGHQFVFLFDRAYDPEFIFSDNVTPVVAWPPTRHPILSLFWFECRIPYLLRKYKADLFVSTDGYLSLRSSIPQVVVMHDINFVHRPQDLPWFISLFYNRFFPKFARKAIRLATVSAYSKADIVAEFNISPENTDIVHNGSNRMYRPSSEDEKSAIREKYTGGHSYFLFVGALHPRKNVTGLLQAFERYRQHTSTETKLVIVGGKMFKTGKISEILESMVSKNEVIFTGRIPSEELRQVYGGALALVFVPFFEGFGIPVIEAMSSGIPVISSNTTSLPEVGGEAAIYVDPDRIDQISSAMHQVSSDSQLRKTMIEKGLLHAKQFSWDKSAEQLWACIEKAFHQTA